MRFHFDLTNGQTTMRDHEGAEANDLAEAIEQARTVIDELRIGGELMDVGDNWQLVIRAPDGTELQFIPIDPKT
jgi:cytosine/adenosine deaminase-related metal-dependent hydrolase